MVVLGRASPFLITRDIECIADIKPIYMLKNVPLLEEAENLQKGEGYLAYGQHFRILHLGGATLPHSTPVRVLCDVMICRMR